MHCGILESFFFLVQQDGKHKKAEREMRLLFWSNFLFHIYFFLLLAKMGIFSCCLNINYSIKMKYYNYNRHFCFQIQIRWNKRGPAGYWPDQAMRIRGSFRTKSRQRKAVFFIFLDILGSSEPFLYFR